MHPLPDVVGILIVGYKPHIHECVAVYVVAAVGLRANPAFPLPAVSQPTSVKLFTNKVGLSFDDAEDMEPAQSLELNPADLDAGTPIPLRLVKFLGVHSLHVCV